VAAQQTITGVVTDSENDPLVGAAVAEFETANGTITNESGEFRLELSDSNAKIQVSFVGFKTQIIGVTGRSVKVELVPDYQLEEIIIQTVRADKEPVTYSTLERETIEKVYHGEQPIFFLEDLTPSIFSYSESGTRLANYGNLRLRGIGQERINMTLNGIPLNDMIDHGIFFSNFTDIGNSIESVQVQRGVGTSSNGAASYAGSINFESINLRNQEAGGTLEVGLGSFGTKRFNASASSGMIDDKWSAYTSFSRLYSDGYRRNTFTDSYSFFLSVGYFGEKDFIKINAFDANAKNGLGYSAVLKSDLENDPRMNYLNPNDEDDFGQQLIQLQHTHTFSNEFSLTSSLYYGAAGGDFLYTYPDSDSTYAQINYPLFNDHYGVMSNFFYTPSGNLELSGGVHGYIFKRTNEESIAPNFANPYYEETSDKKEFSAFAKALYTFGPVSIYGDIQVRSLQLAIQPDYEFMGINPSGDIVKDWTFINPKVGVNYELNDRITTYASYGRTGREPTKIDIFGGAFQLNTSNLDLARSDDFQPEYLNDFEAGVRLEGEMLRINANYFYMDFENEIAPIGEVVAFGVQKRSNIKDSYRTGVELEGSVQPLSLVRIAGNITYMQSQINQLTDQGTGETYSNVSPILSPEWIYGGSLTLSPMESLQLSINARGISESYLEISNDENLVLTGYFVSGLRLNYSLSFIDLAFEINNVLDKSYYTNGAPVDVDYDGLIDGPGYFINAGRNYFITTRINF
jgi:iron complex outermembrane receptor protein